MQLDAMLRHLGAAYYDWLHGRAASADVSRAVDQVAYDLGDKPAVHIAPPRPRGEEPPSGHPVMPLRTLWMWSACRVVQASWPGSAVVAVLAGRWPAAPYG